MIIETLSEWFVALGLDQFKDRLKEQGNEHKLQKSLEDFFAQYRSQFENISRNAEFDLEGVYEFFQKHLDTDLKQVLYGTTSEERERAKHSIYLKVISVSNAVTPESQSQVKSLAESVLQILYDFYLKSVDTGLLLAVNTITSELSPKIDSLAKTVGQTQSTVEQLIISGLTESDIQKAQNGDNSHIALKAGIMQQAISSLHPVKGYRNQIIDGKIISVPASPEAQKNPPKMKITGKTMLGDEPVSDITDETLDYAYRHQLSFKISVKDAKKYLGGILDPNQEEAKSLVGTTIIAKPQSFPPAFPVSLYCDDDCMFDYIMIRTQEILDDGSFIITNTEQTKAPYDFVMILNFSKNHAGVTVKPRECATTKELLLLHKFFLKARMGCTIRLKNLTEQTVFLELREPALNNDDCNKRRFFIETLENLIVMETYYKTQLPLPEPVELADCRWIIFIGRLIKGEKISVPWEQFKFQLCVNESNKKNIQKGIQDLTYIGSVSIKMWETQYSLPVAVTYKKARMKDEDRMIDIISRMEVGETISITYISDDGKGEAVYQFFEYDNQPNMK